MSKKELRYREVLTRYAKGEATREEVRAADPLRNTIREASKLAAQKYVGEKSKVAAGSR